MARSPARLQSRHGTRHRRLDDRHVGGGERVGRCSLEFARTGASLRPRGPRCPEGVPPRAARGRTRADAYAGPAECGGGRLEGGRGGKEWVSKGRAGGARDCRTKKKKT